MSDPDPFEQGERAARKNIPAEANPYRDGTEEHALWAAGHERVAGRTEAARAPLQPAPGNRPLPDRRRARLCAAAS